MNFLSLQIFELAVDIFVRVQVCVCDGFMYNNINDD